MLSDLFWMGRYSERAENLARLLIVTRERYHEYRYRQDMAGSECVPVLLSALETMTGTAMVTGSYAEANATLDALAALGISYAEVTALLEKEGVEKFIVSWNELLDTVSAALEAAK